MRTRGEWNIDLSDFFWEKMWMMEERGRAEAAYAAAPPEEEEEESGRKRMRWVVRMRTEDLTRGKVASSDESSTLETEKHSISFRRRTGRPLPVSCAGGRMSPAIGALPQS